VEKANSCGSISANVLAGKLILARVVATTFARVCGGNRIHEGVIDHDICATSSLKAMMNVVASTKGLMTAFLLQMAKDDISEIIASDQLNKMTKKHI
jgi:hypothetical protein